MTTSVTFGFLSSVSPAQRCASEVLRRGFASGSLQTQRSLARRTFTSSIDHQNAGKVASGEHVNDKKDSLDVQSDAAGKGMDSNKGNGNDTATSQTDQTKSVSKAKKEHPEAPDPAIGMQDERGGKGH